MKNLTEKRNFTITPIYWILGVLLAVSLLLLLLQWNSTKGLRTENKLLEEEKKELLKSVEEKEALLKIDSIKLVKNSKTLKLQDSIIFALEISEKYYKNRAYLNYNKYINEAKSNYNNSSDDDKNDILSDLAGQH